jgi:hypothetical protein
MDNRKVRYRFDDKGNAIVTFDAGAFSMIHADQARPQVEVYLEGSQSPRRPSFVAPIGQPVTVIVPRAITTSNGWKQYRRVVFSVRSPLAEGERWKSFKFDLGPDYSGRMGHQIALDQWRYGAGLPTGILFEGELPKEAEAARKAWKARKGSPNGSSRVPHAKVFWAQ